MRRAAVNRRFWAGKKVLITGNTGFKGGWMSLWLKTLGAEPIGFSLAPPTEPNLFEAAGLDGSMVTITGDVRDLGALKAAVSRHRPEIVLHMAAQALVRRSYESPVETFGTNVMGTVNVLDAVRDAGCVKAVVIVTTDKCYENGDGGEWTRGRVEGDPLGGYDPYSGSKACAELAASAYLRSFFNPEKFHEHGVAVATVRAGNVIGGGDWSQDRLIPDCMRALAGNTTIALRHPDAVRPWQHVLEPLCGYLLLVERLYEEGPVFTGPWNFGPSPEDARPVRWIVERVASLMGGGDWTVDGSQNPHEYKCLMLDSTKARLELKWGPKWDILTALERTAEWFRAYSRKEDMRKMTVRQIRDYEDAATDTGEAINELQIL